MSKPCIPDVVEQFAAYYMDNPAWGSLHIVLDDGNVDTSHVDFCIEYAKQNDDSAGVALGQILARMSKAQRLKLPHSVRSHINTGDRQ